MRLDSRENFPSGMEEYLGYYGWHFSKKMATWASEQMFKVSNGKKQHIDPYDKDAVDSILNKFGVKLENSKGYDAVYVANMCKADFLSSSIPDEQHLARYVKDVIDDADAYDGMPFTRFYADCIGNGTPIDWEEMI